MPKDKPQKKPKKEVKRRRSKGQRIVEESRGKNRPLGAPGHSLNTHQKALVVKAAEYGLTIEDCAEAFGWEQGSLTRYLDKHPDFKRAFYNARLVGDQKLAKTAYRRALEGNTQLLKFLLQIRLKWTENNRIEVSGPDGGPIQSVNINVEMTPQEAAELYAQVREGRAKVVEE